MLWSQRVGHGRCTENVCPMGTSLPQALHRGIDSFVLPPCWAGNCHRQLLLRSTVREPTSIRPTRAATNGRRLCAKLRLPWVAIHRRPRSIDARCIIAVARMQNGC